MGGRPSSAIAKACRARLVKAAVARRAWLRGVGRSTAKAPSIRAGCPRRKSSWPATYSANDVFRVVNTTVFGHIECRASSASHASHWAGAGKLLNGSSSTTTGASTQSAVSRAACLQLAAAACRGGRSAIVDKPHCARCKCACASAIFAGIRVRRARATESMIACRGGSPLWSTTRECPGA